MFIHGRYFALRVLLIATCLTGSGLFAADYVLQFEQTTEPDYIITGRWFSDFVDKWTTDVWFMQQAPEVDIIAVILQHRAEGYDKVIKSKNHNLQLREYYGYDNRVDLTVPTPTMNEWHHAALVPRPTQLDFFFDGDTLGSVEKTYGSTDRGTAYIGSFIGGNNNDRNKGGPPL